MQIPIPPPLWVDTSNREDVFRLIGSINDWVEAGAPRDVNSYTDLAYKLIKQIRADADATEREAALLLMGEVQRASTAMQQAALIALYHTGGFDE